MNSLNHVAIIMDGNGRWAKERFRPRVWGHVRGSHIVSDIVEKSDELGIKYLTMYALSTENLSRPESELKVLYKLLEKYIIKERPRILANNIKFRVIGDYSFVSIRLKKLIEEMMRDSAQATGLNLSFAFGHGGRQTIENAVRYFVDNADQDKGITQEKIDQYFHSDVADIDLMIRTGGDKRLSNFLLWQNAYAELCFIDIKWPDFSKDLFESIIIQYKSVEKRYGSLGDYHNFQEARDAADKKLEKGTHEETL